MTRHFTAVLRRGSTVRDFQFTLASIRGILCCADGNGNDLATTMNAQPEQTGLSPDKISLPANLATPSPRNSVPTVIEVAARNLTPDPQETDALAGNSFGTPFKRLGRIGSITNTFSVRDLHIAWFAVEDDIVVCNIEQLPHIDFVEEDKPPLDDSTDIRMSKQVTPRRKRGRPKKQNEDNPHPIKVEKRRT